MPPNYARHLLIRAQKSACWQQFLQISQSSGCLSFEEPPSFLRLSKYYMKKQETI